MAVQISRQIDSERVLSENELDGIHTPTYTNAALLRSRSITEENTEASACLYPRTETNKTLSTIWSEQRILIVVDKVKEAKRTLAHKVIERVTSP